MSPGLLTIGMGDGSRTVIAKGLVGVLSKSRLFQGLLTAEVESVLHEARNRRAEARAFIFVQGDPATALYVLHQGRIKLTRITPEGRQAVLRVGGPGYLFGAIAALSKTVYPVSAEVMEDSQVIYWDRDTIAHLMARFPQVAINALRLLSEQYNELQDRYMELATERVERRVARGLLRLTTHVGRKVEHGILIDMPLSHQDLADMTGTTIYTISRIFSRWEQQELIETGRERVVIRRPHALVMIADDLVAGAQVGDSSGVDAENNEET
jgi:CRP/FNR family transcriptional regulator, nitrogen oxide reductase regulator